MSNHKELPTHAKITVRSVTKARYEDAAKARRLSMVEMADLAIDAWIRLPRDQQDSLLLQPAK